MMSHPYISGPGNIAGMIDHLRKSFPQTIDSSTVKKLGLAPKNESYVINALQFIGVIDEDGKKTEKAAAVFSKHKDEDFEKAFAELITIAYTDLFDLQGEASWSLDRADLVTFFRNSDQTSDAIGGRQAGVFTMFAEKAGKKIGSENSPAKKSKPSAKPAVKKTNDKKVEKTPSTTILGDQSQFGLSVKVEINLPSDASAETYDNIFKSIRKNLIND